MKALGEFMRSCLRGNFEPFFVVEEDGSPPEDAFQIPMSENMISGMYLRGSFSLSKVRINVSKELSATNIFLCLQTDPYPYSTNSVLPISGFPRELISEDSKAQGKFHPPHSLNQVVDH